MTLDEFASRLPNLSDGKLRRMLVAAKRDGLIEPLEVLKAEARRRGWKKAPTPLLNQEAASKASQPSPKQGESAAPIYTLHPEINVSLTTFIPKEMPLDEVLMATSSGERPHVWAHSEGNSESLGRPAPIFDLGLVANAKKKPTIQSNASVPQSPAPEVLDTTQVEGKSAVIPPIDLASEIQVTPELPASRAPLPVLVHRRIRNGRLTGGWAIAALLLVAVGGIIIRTLRSR